MSNRTVWILCAAVCAAVIAAAAWIAAQPPTPCEQLGRMMVGDLPARCLRHFRGEP